MNLNAEMYHDQEAAQAESDRLSGQTTITLGGVTIHFDGEQNAWVYYPVTISGREPTGLRPLAKPAPEKQWSPKR